MAKKQYPIKWAIMRSEIGLYAMRLIETLDDAEGLFSRCVLEQNPSRMPVLVNFAGGYMSYDPDDARIVEIKILPNDQEPLTLEEQYPRNSPLFQYGWISPEGDTFRCAWNDHARCASAIVEHLLPDRYGSVALRELYGDGWAEVRRDSDMGTTVWSEQPLTGQQIAVLVQLGFDRQSPQVADRIRRARQAHERGEGI